MASDLFLELTPERVLAAVEAAGLSTTGVCYPLNSFENRVYEVELGDKSRVVAKFYRPTRWSIERILEEHAFLAELEAEELPVCAVREFPDGSTLRTIDGIHYSLSDRRGGRAPDELDQATALRLGRFVGRMHNVAVRRAEVDRPRLDAERYVHRALRFLDEHDVLPGHLKHRYFETARSIAAMADERMEGVAVHRIHADLHLGNILFRDGELRVLDFDDMAIGPPVQDLWLAVPGRDETSLALRAALIEGYEEFRLFDHATLSLVEPLRGLRMVRYAGWLARRWHDPAFKAGWPHFGTGDYWQDEVDDLEDQLRVIYHEEPIAGEASSAPSAVRREAEQAELTNKDFFWDWEGD